MNTILQNQSSRWLISVVALAIGTVSPLYAEVPVSGIPGVSVISGDSCPSQYAALAPDHPVLHQGVQTTAGVIAGAERLAETEADNIVNFLRKPGSLQEFQAVSVSTGKATDEVANFLKGNYLLQGQEKSVVKGADGVSSGYTSDTMSVAQVSANFNDVLTELEKMDHIGTPWHRFKKWLSQAPLVGRAVKEPSVEGLSIAAKISMMDDSLVAGIRSLRATSNSLGELTAKINMLMGSLSEETVSLIEQEKALTKKLAMMDLSDPAYEPLKQHFLPALRRRIGNKKALYGELIMASQGSIMQQEDIFRLIMEHQEAREVLIPTFAVNKSIVQTADEMKKQISKSELISSLAERLTNESTDAIVEVRTRMDSLLAKPIISAETLANNVQKLLRLTGPEGAARRAALERNQAEQLGRMTRALEAAQKLTQQNESDAVFRTVIDGGSGIRQIGH